MTTKAGSDPRLRMSTCLPANAELRDELAVALDVGLLQVVEKATALTDELEKTTAGVVVLLVES